MATSRRPLVAAAVGVQDDFPKREISINGQYSELFPANKIKTSKYTWATFLPLNLWEQMHKFGNVYFLLISVLMYLGEHTSLFIGTIKAFSTLATLVAMMSVTAAMALLDDRRRAEADRETNERQVKCLERREEKWKPKRWEEVMVGDILLVREGQEFPADLVPLYCTGEEGTCYVSTANLDGETNLKLKSAARVVYEALEAATRGACQTTLGGQGRRSAFSKPVPTYECDAGQRQGHDVDEKPLQDLAKAAASLRGVVTAEVPQKSIHTFKGAIEITERQTDARTRKTPGSLDSRHLLLRGTVLRNTNWCVGIVVYTGPETRMVMNSSKAPMKMSNVERVTNRVMLVVLLAQAFLAVVSDVLFLLTSGVYKSYWYLYVPELWLPDCLSYWLTFFVLYSNMMPISLYPTMEWCNMWQAYFIKHDKQMYYRDLSFQAGVRSSNLCQELGQVSYIFSDKTGTLTQNVMELKRIYVPGGSVGGAVYPPDRLQPTPGYGGGDSMRAHYRDKGPAQQAAIDSVLEVLAVTHTVMVAQGPDQEPKYEAESPDESALVEAAACVGWKFTGRASSSVHVAKHGALADIVHHVGEKEDGVSRVKYEVLATNAFDSTRKRMSVVVRNEEGHCFVLAKGADNVMMSIAKDRNSVELRRLQEQLDAFSREGLRTLVLGRRTLKPDEVADFVARHQSAQNTMDDREAALVRVAQSVERDLEIVGATGIEDKLQEHVPKTIRKIRDAGIKLWVLTGDKLETAKNIGYSAGVLDSGTMTVDEVDHDGELGTPQAVAEMEQKLKPLKASTSPLRALMVTGVALEVVMAEQKLKQLFLDVAKECTSVIACRVSPLQKAEMVRLVREGVVSEDGSRPVTLSVGDGANDVPMIQEAQVGVGLAGREGRQAVNNSDFAIGQFSYLQRLLLVHGRWNYRRVCKFILFTFWRNAVQVLMTFYYTFFSGYSGTCLFEDWIRLSFNFLCSFPIMATGCMDQDVPEGVALSNPGLYETGRLGWDLNAKKIGATLVSSFTHSLILLLVTYLAFPGMDLKGAGDYYTFGTAVYTCLLVDMNYRVAKLNYTHNRYTVGSIAASFLCYVLYLIAYPCQKWVADMLAPNMYMVPYSLASTPPFWLCLLSVPVLAMTADGAIELAYREVRKRSQTRRSEAWHFPRTRRPSKEAGQGPCDRLYEFCLLLPDEDDTDPLLEGEEKADWPPGLDTSAFAQQRLRCGWNWRRGNWRVLVILPGALLIVCGAVSLYKSQCVSQIRIHYEDHGQDEWRLPPDPMWTDPKEIVNKTGLCRNPGVCKINVTVLTDMRPPILVYYAVGPFFQNYNGYLKSEVAKELMGEVVDDGVRDRTCVGATKLDGDRIVPCGMKVLSMFNDTFSIKGVDIISESIAWASDLDRYQNPPDYLKRPGTRWLHDLYPGVVGEAEGVKNEHFSVWMRPSALHRVWNPYGVINQDLRENQVLEITINSTFPVKSLKGYKHLVLTETNMLGGRHPGLGFLLLSSGVPTLIAAIAMCLCLQARCDDSRAIKEDPNEAEA